MGARLWSLDGLLDYDQVREIQLALVEKRAADQIPDTILFLEHRAVVTQGRGLQFTGSAGPRQMPVPPGLAVVQSERGGDLTYHGPGQLVVYPICKLDGKGVAPERDVARWIRGLEQGLIDLCSSFGVVAGREAQATGVWVGDKKIASIGIAVRRWVSYHGVALNVTNDLRPFLAFSPCGFDPEVMTRLKDCAGRGDWSEGELEAGLRSELEERFARALGVQDSVESLSLEAALRR